jgi:hypothetical protein
MLRVALLSREMVTPEQGERPKRARLYLGAWELTWFLCFVREIAQPEASVLTVY